MIIYYLNRKKYYQVLCKPFTGRFTIRGEFSCTDPSNISSLHSNLSNPRLFQFDIIQSFSYS